MSILLKTSKRKKILVVENKNKNGVIESPKQKKSGLFICPFKLQYGIMSLEQQVFLGRCLKVI